MGVGAGQANTEGRVGRGHPDWLPCSADDGRWCFCQGACLLALVSCCKARRASFLLQGASAAMPAWPSTVYSLNPDGPVDVTTGACGCTGICGVERAVASCRGRLQELRRERRFWLSPLRRWLAPFRCAWWRPDDGRPPPLRGFPVLGIRASAIRRDLCSLSLLNV
jgi:hypothetical protein